MKKNNPYVQYLEKYEEQKKRNTKLYIEIYRLQQERKKMELTVNDLKSLIGTEKKEDTFLKIGGKYLFRTVTMIYTGEIVRMCGQEIELKDAAWIADTGRFADNLKSCEFSEVEPYLNNVIIFRGALLDITEISKLPRVQK